MKPLISSICLLVVVAVSSTVGAGSSEANEAQPGHQSDRPATDFATLLHNLRAAGLNAHPEGKVFQPFFPMKGRIIKIGSDDVQVFEFPSIAAADAQGVLVSREGTTVGGTKIHWMSLPHFYKKGKLIVLYVGEDAEVIKALEKVLGPQFAGK